MSESETFGEALATDFSSGMVEPEPPFNPALHARNLPGRGGPSTYLDVKWRIEWFRRENPAGQLLSELVEISPEHAVFKCIAVKEDGGSASGFGSETRADFNDFIEKAETKARGRALEGLGYGTTAMVADEALADSPVERSPSQERSTNAQRLSHGQVPQNGHGHSATPTPRSAPPRANAGQPAASQRTSANPPNATPPAAKPVVLSDAPYDLSKGPSPAKIGELSDLMAARGESLLTVPIRFLSKAIVNDAILRLKNGGASGLDRLWIRQMAASDNVERNRTFCGDVLMTFAPIEDQRNRFGQILRDHPDADENLWWFLLWATKVVHEDEGSDHDLTVYRMGMLARKGQTDAFMLKIAEFLDGIGSSFGAAAEASEHTAQES